MCNKKAMQSAIDALQPGYKFYLVEDCIVKGDVQHRIEQVLAELKDKVLYLSEQELY